MKTEKFVKYIAKTLGASMSLCTANIHEPISYAKADGVNILEVTEKEFFILMAYFSPPYNWTDMKVWNIKLKII